MLSNRQRSFVAEYLVDKNATKAATRAGYSVATAKSQGSRLLAHPDVKAAIAEAMARMLADAGVKAEDVIARLKAIAWSTPGETWRGAEVLKAVELLGRALGMWVDKAEDRDRGATLEELILAATRMTPEEEREEEEREERERRRQLPGGAGESDDGDLGELIDEALAAGPQPAKATTVNVQALQTQQAREAREAAESRAAVEAAARDEYNRRGSRVPRDEDSAAPWEKN